MKTGNVMTRICGKIGLFFCTGLLLTFAAIVTAAGESIPPAEGKGDDGDRQGAGKALRETTAVPRAEEQEWLPAASDPAVEDFVFCRMFQLHRRMMRRMREKFHDAEFFQPESRLPEHPLFEEGGDDVPHLPPPSPGWFLKECAEGYVLTLKPGNVIDKTLHVTVEDAVLTISGETKSIREDSSGDRYFRERSYGSFQRSFTLPPGTDAEKIRAVEHDGVLTVTIPRRAECRKPEGDGRSCSESGSCRNLFPPEPGEGGEEEKSPVREFFHGWFDWFEAE